MPEPDMRLDAALAERGLARSRTHAARLIADGLVTVDGHPTIKSSVRVTARSAVVVARLDHYVSRAAHKLIAALDAFDIKIDGCRRHPLGDRGNVGRAHERQRGAHRRGGREPYRSIASGMRDHLELGSCDLWH